MDKAGKSAKSESDRPFRVEICLFVDGDIVVIVSVDIVAQPTSEDLYSEPSSVITSQLGPM